MSNELSRETNSFLRINPWIIAVFAPTLNGETQTKLNDGGSVFENYFLYPPSMDNEITERFGIWIVLDIPNLRFYDCLAFNFPPLNSLCLE
jgi:hypothetical protein